MNDNDTRLKNLYDKYLDYNISHLTGEESYSAVELSAIMIAQALMFYRTVLSEFEYEKIVKQIYDSRKTIHSLNDGLKTIQ